MVWNGANTTPIYDLINVTAPVGPTTGTTVATATPITFDGLTPIEVTFNWNDVAKSNTDPFAMVLRMDGSQIEQYGLALAVNGGGGLIRWVGTPAAGSHTFTAALTRISGTGTATLQASATQPAQLLTREAVALG